MGFVRQFREEKWLPHHLADRLPWKTLVQCEPQAIIATKDDGLLCGYRMEPYDLAGRSEAERGSLILRINQAWKRLERWAIWVKSTRVPWVPPKPTHSDDPLIRLLRQQEYERLVAKGLFTQEYAIYLWHRPPPLLKSLAKAAFLGKGHAYLDTKEAQLDTFQAECALWTSYLDGCCDLTPMTSEPEAPSELLTALHAPLCLHPHPVNTPEWPLDIGRYLVDYGMYPKRFPPQLGLEHSQRQHIRTLSLTPELPPETWTCMLEGLFTLGFNYELSARWVTLPSSLANKKLNRMQRDIVSTKKSFRDISLEIRRGREIEKKNRYVDRQEDDIDEMRDLMLSDEFAMGDEVLSVVLKHEDLHELNRRAHAVIHVFQQAGCVVSDLDVCNTEGWLATQPGSVYADVRTLRWTSMNGAHVHPFYGPWQGESYVPALKGPPLFYAVTEGSMPYGVSPYVNDLGLVMQIGPYGTGKSTLNNKIAACFRQEVYDGGADITIWDIDKSAMGTTLCYGGAWYDLGKGEAPIQVLADLDDPDELPHLYQWLVNRIKEQLATAQFGWDPDIGMVLMGVLTELQQSRRPRRLGELLYLLTQRMNKLGSPGARAMYGERASDLARLLPKVINALQPFAWGGAYGRLLDAPVDRLQFSTWTTFELRELLDQTEVYPAFLEVLYRRQRKSRHGQLCHDQYNEAWHFFSTPFFVKTLKEDIPSWRKQRKSAIFSTQSLDQLSGNALTELLLSSCQVRWFGPNPQAFDTKVKQLYLDVGLHEEELDRYIVRARAKREWYVVRPLDGGRPRKRLIDVRLSDLEAAVYGANSLEDLDQMDAILAQHGREGFGFRWLQYKGFDVPHPQAAEGMLQQAVGA